MCIRDSSNTTWKPQWSIADPLEVSSSVNYDDWYLAHMVYLDYEILSSAFHDIKEKLIHRLEQLEGNNFSQVTRIKANFYPHTQEVKEHKPHRDAHTGNRLRGALYCFNTCDGYTGFADGTKVESVENRLILFDSLEDHFSTSTSNAQARINLNINYV